MDKPDSGTVCGPLVCAVLTRRIFPDLLERMRASWRVVDNQEDEALDGEALARRLHSAQILLCDPTRAVGEALLDRAPGLRIVSNIAVGYNNIDLQACTAHGVVATNTPDVLTEATADHAWALMLATARRVTESERWTRAGHWRGFAFDGFLGADVHGATLGILGMGRIGSAIARRAAGFRMQVLYHNRQPVPEHASAKLGHGRAPVWVSFDDLLARSDFLIVTVPLGAQTRHIIDRAAIGKMRHSAYLINIARGGVVDDEALIEALAQGRLAGAAIDVMENEPAFNPQFLALDNLVMTPHIGSATLNSRRSMVALAISNAEQVVNGERPRAILNPEVWNERRGA